MKQRKHVLTPIIILTLIFTFSFSIQPAQAAPQTFDVNTTDDTVDANIGDNVCADSTGACSLRAAIQEANGNGNPLEIDIINVPAGTYTLTIAGTDEYEAATGDLNVQESVNIIGAGAASTIIQAGLSPETGIDRVFHITADTGEIANVTVRHGNRGNSNGGGILREAGEEAITITNSIITQNVSGLGCGGGVNNTAGFGSLSLIGSTVSSNSADYGGGVCNEGTMTITESSVLGNNAVQFGGGIFNDFQQSELTVSNSTIAYNRSDNGGGGISNYDYESIVMITGSTLVENSADRYGGAILNAGQMTVANTTIAENSGGPGEGGGIASGGNAAIITTLANTIVARNPIGGNCRIIEPGMFVSDNTNLSDDSTCSSGFVAANDLNSVDARLGSLADYGGPTQTLLPLIDSPAIDAGNCVAGSD